VHIKVLQEGSDNHISWTGGTSGLNVIGTSNPFTAVVTDTFMQTPVFLVYNPVDTLSEMSSHTLYAYTGPALDLPDSTVCPGSAVSYNLDVSNTYQWYDGDHANGKTFSSTGTFWLDAYNVYGCQSTDTFTITHFVPDTNVLSLTSAAICPADSVVVSLLPGFSGPVWSDGATTFSHALSLAGTYTVSANDPHSCGVSDTVQINVLTPVPFDLGNDSVLCPESNFVINAPSTHHSYQWSTASTASSESFTGYSGAVWLSASDLNNCVYTDTLQLDLYTPVAFSLGNDTSVCPGDTIVLNAPLTHTSYNWFDGSSLNNLQLNGYAGWVWLSALDAHQCQYTDTLSIALHSPVAFTLGNDTTLCPADTLTLYAPLSHTAYTWSDGSTSSSLQLNGYNGQVWLRAFDLHQCAYTDTIALSQFIPIPFSMGADTNMCNGDTLTLFAPVTHSAYAWSDGSAGTTYSTVNTTGAVWLSAADAHGCRTADTIMVTYNFCLSAASADQMPETFMVYPNPFNNYISIRSDISVPANITLTDMMGKIIIQTTANFSGGTVSTLSLPGQLPAGAYVIHVQYEQKSRKVILIRE
jgi:hypothetical protein